MATFSNTHLRIPDGFAELLMGLAKEVLRDQPEDIPTFAANFFEALLKQREESGMNHAEWTAKQESSMIHTFKDSKPSPGAEPASDTRTSKGKSNESRSENETSNSAEASELPTTRANFSEEDHLTESTAEENHGENRNISTEKGIRDEESIKLSPIADVQSDKVSGTEDEGDSTIYKADKSDRAAQEKDTSSAIDTDVLSFSGVSNVDVCAQELGTAEDGGSDTQESDIVDREMSESDVEGEEDSEEKESVVTPHSGLADVDICATELGGTERQTESATADRDTHTTEEESFKTLVQLPLAQFGTPEGNQQEAEDQTRKTKEEDETDTKASAEETHEGLPHNESALDFNATPKEDSLVEISFEDVPEAQQITEVKEEKALQTELLEEVQQEEEAGLEEVTDMVQHGEPETEEVEKEFYSEREEIESQLRASDIMEENVVTNDTNLNDRAEDNTSISSSHQPSTEVDSKSPEEERDQTDEDDETREDRFSEDETKANYADFKEDETTGTVGEDNEDIDSKAKDEDGDGGAETRSSQALVDLQSKDTQIEKDEEVAESDSEAREKRDEVCEDVTTADRRHVEEEAPPVSEADATQLEKNERTDEQEECSRPQEEEDIMDIPLDDPEANRAAAKIQAGFRGHMTRKKMKPEDKAEGEEVSSTGDVLNGSQGATATGGSGAVESDDTSVPEQ